MAVYTPARQKPGRLCAADIRTSQILSKAGSEPEQSSALEHFEIAAGKWTWRSRDDNTPGWADNSADLGLPLLEQGGSTSLVNPGRRD